MLKLANLKNDLKILKFPKVESKLFIAGFVAPTGTVMEEGNFPEGINILTERLFWCGTDKYPSTRQLNLVLESLGGVFHTILGYEFTQYYIEVPAYNQYKAISLLSDIIQHSHFARTDVENQKKLLLDQIYSSDYSYQLNREGNSALLSLFYLNSKQDKGVPVSLESLKNLSQADIYEYLSHQYRPDKCYLIVSGNYDEKNLSELIDQEWSFWNPKVKEYFDPTNLQTETEVELPFVSYRQRGIIQSEIHLGFSIDLRPQEKFSDEETKELLTPNELKKIIPAYLNGLAKLMVLNNILGQGYSSRLWSKGVEGDILFNQIASTNILMRYTWFLRINGVTENSQFLFALECILEVLESLKKSTVSINEISKAKESIKGRMILEHEDLLQKTTWEVDNFLCTNMVYTEEDLYEAISKVTAPDIRALACDIFVPERMAFFTIGTAKETRVVDKLIKRYLG
jgi:predicted Zn-dependent peptidase